VNDRAEKDRAEKDESKSGWVRKRFACSLPNVFNTLRLQVEEDVKTRNDLRPPNSPYEFSVGENVGEFTVFLKGEDLQRTVVFKLAEHAIVVSDDKGNHIFDVTLTFSDEGECRLNANEKTCDFWQVRRMALEEIMFRAN
jgi:hypothetical protein